MNRFDSYMKQYEKKSTPDKKSTEKKNEKSISKDKYKLNSINNLTKKEDKNSIKNKSTTYNTTTSNATTNNIQVVKNNSKLLNENLKLILTGNDRKVYKDETPLTEQRLTRSASKNIIEDSPKPKKDKILRTANKSQIRNKTSDSANKSNIKFTNNKKSNYTGKKEYLPKTSFLMKKKLKFKESKSPKKEENNLNKSESKIELVTSDIQLLGKNTEVKKQKTIREEALENKYKNKYSFVKSKVKQFLKNQEDKKKEDPNNDNNNDNNVANITIPTAKPQTKNKNFVKMNLNKGYQEKKLHKVKNIRKMKMDRGKAFYKFQNQMANNQDMIYLGTGKEGLETEIIIDDENVLKEEIVNNNISQFANVQSKVPCFSEGYYNNIQEETNDALEEFREENNKIKIEDNLNKSNFKDLSSIKVPRPGRTPTRLMTNKLTSALKSSLKKNITLDTELRILSKEFRFLLSGRKKEAEELIQRKSVEKKLNFNEDEKIIPEDEMDVDNTDSVQNDNLNEEEIQQLENDILLKVLDENFGFSSFLPGQLETIKNILNAKNSLLILPPGGGKSLCFQLPSLVSEGLTIVISPLLSSITDQITNLPNCLSGACLSSFTNQKQRNEIFEAIKCNRIRILFTTPERFAIENFSEIDEIAMIVLDEASCACPLAPNFRSAYVSVSNIIKKLKPNVTLFLSNSMTKILQENIKNQYKIDQVIKEKIELPKNLKIFISKEDNKLGGMIKLLKSQQYKNIGSTIIFCNTKKNVDKVTSYLNSNGLSASSYHSGKSEMERQMIQVNFMTDKIKIMVCTMAFSMGISKNDIRLVVLFDMPPSLEHFLQQVGRGGRDKKETLVHIFLNDEDYFLQRNMIYQENIDKSQIMKFLDHFCQLVNPQFKNVKRTYSEAFENKPIVNEVQLPKTISLNFTKASEYSQIKKQTQLYLLLSLIESKELNPPEDSHIENENALQFSPLGIGPSVINLRFYKTLPEKLAETEPNIKLILESSRDSQGVKRFNTLEVCEKIGITYIDLINYLYHLQSRSELGYETKDEGIFLNVQKLPNSFKEILTFLHERIQYLININLRKLNASYVLIRKFASHSIESFLNNKSGSNIIKCLNTYADYNEYQYDLRQHFENYFVFNDIKVDVHMAGSESELSLILPIVIVDTQKDKTKIVKDIEEMVKKEVEKNLSLTVIEVINILFGITGSEGKSPYYSNPLWAKFQQYDYQFINEISENVLQKEKSDQISKGMASKKLKTG